MNMKIILYYLLISAFLMGGCVSKKRLLEADSQLSTSKAKLVNCQSTLSKSEQQAKEMKRNYEEEVIRNQELKNSKDVVIAELKAQSNVLKEQIVDLKKQREQQYSQVGDLTVLSKTANDNINQTIKQLAGKDQYIRYLMDARSKADSINLVLSVNLKSMLKNGIEDEDIEVKVDKTVVFINLSDKMLYQSGSYVLTPRANEVLAKIADIIKSKPDLELMVEGYTDNAPIKTACIEDNWDLSVKRASSVVRALHEQFGVNPNKLIAAGRGEYNTLADNTTSEGRSTNRRTRIILLPKLNQFYDLLKPPTN